MSVIGHQYPTVTLSRPRLSPVLRLIGFVLGMTAVLLALMAIRVLSVADTMPAVAKAIFG
ncbi:hypothetical protein [Oceanibaculum nanhaiense]|uniref:hypothetical protein n=1 Tax=Oceanibaculum nanhaiense TaxID=1909734 RepID=UPI00396D8943